MASLDERVDKIEQLVDKLIAAARENAMGRALLKNLGIE